jgi:nucleoside-triphosphatase THEP1
MKKRRKVYSADDVYRAKFKTVRLDDEWEAAIGSPHLAGSWFIYGQPKHGKTTFTLMMAKMLAQYARVLYNSVEEGFSLTMQNAFKRVGIMSVRRRVLLSQMSFNDLVEYLKRHKSPNIVIVDSVQYMELKMAEYEQLKTEFPQKLFVYISHVKAGAPAGIVAEKIMRYSDVVFFVKGFRAFPSGRYEGNKPITISEELAAKFWGE